MDQKELFALALGLLSRAGRMGSDRNGAKIRRFHRGADLKSAMKRLIFAEFADSKSAPQLIFAPFGTVPKKEVGHRKWD